MLKIGIIGGSGLEKAEMLKDKKIMAAPETPYGKTSSDIATGKIKGAEVFIIARHGPKHSIIPSNVPYRANIMALKNLGVRHVLATTACGSLREKIKPGHLVLPDQFIDRTTKRASTFYEGPKVCHIQMAEPFCPKLREVLHGVVADLGFEHEKRATVVTIEGPRFSTRAESLMFRNWGADIINMSTVPEVVLAREAGMCYAAIAMATDYDCFDEEREPVTWEEVLRVVRQNVDNVKRVLVEAIPQIQHTECGCMTDFETAVEK